MRLIGNKTKLLEEIARLLEDRGVRGGTLIDIFSGTANVGRHFKKRGFRVISNDNLFMCYAQAVAGVEVSSYPAFRSFRREHASVLTSEPFSRTLHEKYHAERTGETGRGLPWAAAPLLEAVHFLNRCIRPRRGLIFRNYCPGGPAGRRYFCDENGMKIDGIVEFLRASRRSELLSREEFYLLLASLLDAADKVANISGTYGAYLKGWQPSSLKDLDLEPPVVVESPLSHSTFRRDANDLISELDGDVLYVDPPYNQRQYAANYHVMEILAEYHTISDLEGFEGSLYGKTGLRPYGDLKSRYCVPPGRRGSGDGDVLSSMTDLILSSRARHVVVSYNEEGLLSRQQIGDILTEFSGGRKFDFRKNFRTVEYRRFRSDSDRVSGSEKGARSYKVLKGRTRDEIAEWLFFATRADSRSVSSSRKSGPLS